MNIQVIEKLGLLRFREENESARSDDVDHFRHIWTVEGDEKILEVNPLVFGAIFWKSHDHTHQILGIPSNQFPQAIISLHQVFLLKITRSVISDCQYQRIKKIQDYRNLEQQFLYKVLCAMQRRINSSPPPDAFSITAFDVVINRDRALGAGGFGEVFEGNLHGTKVAVKLIRNFYPPVSTVEPHFLGSHSLVPSSLKTRYAS